MVSVIREMFCIATAMMLLAGCWHQSPVATPVRSDTNDRVLPQREIHFVEHGHRATGVLLSASEGFDNPFRADWRAVLVPTQPISDDGLVWRGKTLHRDAAVAVHRLPAYRDARLIARYADLARLRMHETAVWILSTDPFVLGLPAGDPQLTWREFATRITGVGETKHLIPLKPFIARFVEELAQPLDRIILFPTTFWDVAPSGELRDIQLSVIRLREPMSIDEGLDKLAHEPASSLGEMTSISFYEPFQSEQEHGRALQADRARLERQ